MLFSGIKVAMALEELVILRSSKEDFNYEAHTVDIRRAENRKPEFAKLNKNGKIPVIHDPNGPNGPVTIWESGAILLYLAEQYHSLLPHDDPNLRIEAIKWLFWGSTGISSQCKAFGFYYKYCMHRLPYCVHRYAKECDRLLLVLEYQLAHEKHWVVGGTLKNATLLLYFIISIQV